MTLNEKVIKNKIVELIVIFKCCSDHFSIRVGLNSLNSKFSKFEKFKYFLVLNDFEWKSYEYQSCRTHQDLQTLFISLFHLTKFVESKFWISTIDKLKQDFGTLNDVEWKSVEYQSFITHQDLQSLFMSFFSW
jgi:hypothetical protein